MSEPRPVTGFTGSVKPVAGDNSVGTAAARVSVKAQSVSVVVSSIAHSLIEPALAFNARGVLTKLSPALVTELQVVVLLAVDGERVRLK